MSRLRFTKTTQPGTPATNKTELFIDTTTRRASAIDDTGVVSVLMNNIKPNLLINGDFTFCQRAAVALTNITSPSATNRIYSADRWGFTSGNVTTPQFQQVDTSGSPETGITARYYARYKQLTNAAKVALTQVVLSRDTLPEMSRTVRFTVYMKYSVGSNRDMRLGLVSNTGTVDAPTAAQWNAFNANGTDPTLGASLAYLQAVLVEGTGATLVGSSATCPITTTWTRFSATFVVPTTCKNLMPVIFSNNTFAVNDDLLITQCMLTDGADIPDYIPNDYQTELIKCQQFYYKSFNLATVPANGANNGYHAGIIGKAAATALACHVPVRYPTRMRTAATPTLFSPGATGSAVPYRLNGATPAPQTSAAIVAASEHGCTITATGDANGAVGDHVGVHVTVDSEI